MGSESRYQQGKHLTLVEDRYIEFLGNIPSNVRPAFANWTQNCEEAMNLISRGELSESLLPMVQSVLSYLRNSIKYSGSVEGFKSNQLVDTIKGLENQAVHRDAGMLVFNPQLQSQMDKPKEKRSDLRQRLFGK